VWRIGFGWFLELNVELACREYLHSDGSHHIKTEQTNFFLEGG